MTEQQPACPAEYEWIKPGVKVAGRFFWSPNELREAYVKELPQLDGDDSFIVRIEAEVGSRLLFQYINCTDLMPASPKEFYALRAEVARLSAENQALKQQHFNDGGKISALMGEASLLRDEVNRLESESVAAIQALKQTHFDIVQGEGQSDYQQDCERALEGIEKAVEALGADVYDLALLETNETEKEDEKSL